jgi:DNA-binding transcriptional ArsR family regulator
VTGFRSSSSGGNLARPEAPHSRAISSESGRFVRGTAPRQLQKQLVQAMTCTASLDILIEINNYMVVDYLSTTLSALADPTRRAILARLARGSAAVGQLAEPFNMSQQAVSKHLDYLHRARLIKKHRKGRQHLCTLNPTPFREVIHWVETCRRFWEESFERLDLVLKDMKETGVKDGQR